ncbi:MAG: ATP synthase F1 subunit epsilon [Deltaproteobacteria bacterium]|nr:ATP synthase F1 subunit epsilon [Deltaproteobacteria bacterium]
MPLSLSIVTPEGQARTETAEELVVPAIGGEIGLLPGHVPLVSALKPGTMSVTQDGKRTKYVLSSGFVEIDADHVTILTDAFEPVEGIDVERARRAYEDASSKLKQLTPEDPGFLGQERRKSRALARLEAAGQAPT